METKELEQLIYKNYDWDKVNYETTSLYTPPIKYGKVIKVYEGDTILIATKLPYIDDTKKNSLIYRFIIYLDGICSPKNNSNKDNLFSKTNVSENSFSRIDKISKDKLSKLILGKIVEVRSIMSDKYGHLYANIFLDLININEFMIEHNYAVKCIKCHRHPCRIKDSLYDYEKINNQQNLLTIEISNKLIGNQNIPLILPNINKYLSKKTDCFLSHNWGENNTNHNKILIINKELQKRGLVTWFDENEMEGNIRYKMAEGIDNTRCVIIFITKEYRDKVNGIDMKDNCNYEFTYAVNQLGSQNMIPVLMDKDMYNTRDWKGELGAALGSMLYFDFIEDKIKSSEDLEKKYESLYNIIKKIIKNK